MEYSGTICSQSQNQNLEILRDKPTEAIWHTPVEDWGLIGTNWGDLLTYNRKLGYLAPQ